MANYQSEITKFLEELKKQRPGLEARQFQGRELLWDKSINTELTDGFEAATVPQQPYVYQTK